jgi:hypothetical protein
MMNLPSAVVAIVIGMFPSFWVSTGGGTSALPVTSVCESGAAGSTGTDGEHPAIAAARTTAAVLNDEKRKCDVDKGRLLRLTPGFERAEFIAESFVSGWGLVVDARTVSN